MNSFELIEPTTWATVILAVATVFTCAWTLDALTHKELVKTEITDNELSTHRRILIASFLMEISLVCMFWFGALMLPFFIATFITRTVYEFIDELKFHTDRCSFYESLLHLVMWISVLTKTSAMFIWGFFFNYKGILDLPVVYYVWGILLFLSMSYVSYKEWNR